MAIRQILYSHCLKLSASMYSSVIISSSSRPLQQHSPGALGDRFLHVPTLDESSKLKMETGAKELKSVVKRELIATYKDPTQQLEYIDAIERLGVAVHFESYIEEALEQFYDNFSNQVTEKDDLYHASLRLRILRQHGFNVPSDVMRKFKDGTRGFKSKLSPNDVQGMLSLYEASQVLTHEDEILEEARRFTTTFLGQNTENWSPNLAKEVASALHQPLHRGIPIVQMRKYFSFYENRSSHSKTLLSFAKSEFNLAQSLYQKEVKKNTMWWKSMHARVPFARDRLVEIYFLAVGYLSAPENALGREIVTKMYLMLIAVLDDLYDADGTTLEDSELFTQAIQRWDESYVAQCSENHKSCYQAVVETINKIEQDLMVQGRSEYIQYAKSEVQRLTRAFLQEAKWGERKVSLTYEEYMEVGVETGCPTLGNVIPFLGISDATKAGYEWVCQAPIPKLMRAVGLQARVLNDMGSRKQLRDVGNPATSLASYEQEHGASEEQAFEFLKLQVENAWKDVNQGMLRPHPIPQSMLLQILNFARVSNVYYRDGTDRYTKADESLKKDFASILLFPAT